MCIRDRLQLETSRLGPTAALMEFYSKLANNPRCGGLNQTIDAQKRPYLTMKARLEGRDLSLFTMLVEFTTAQDIAMSERRVELFFPADDMTRDYFQSLAL